MSTDRFEGLGTFFLGTSVDPETGERVAEAPAEAPVLYDAADLTTHAAIIGMTGSGKTGLGIGLIEEAALDRVPVLAIDPKGDLGNLLLTFPDLAPADFAPWVDAQEARRKGRSVEEHAAATADLWRHGLGDWGQGPERIRRLRETAAFTIFTPGSSSGQPLSVLKSFAPPGEAVREDADLWRERLDATASGLLALVGVESDPLQDPEHVFIARVLDTAWQAGQSLDLADLIRALQAPPFEQLGVLDVDTFFPARERGKLAMRLNGLLASPSFAAWGEGQALDIDALLYAPDGRPRVSVLSIAHLGEAERQFFVTTLLTEVIAWMRAQPGTGSLRALLYMDEVFGYLPPVANPPSKRLFLTLLKQARAFGLGLVLATQNPVDLDYKALSNCGTWFVGRLQTERDKARLLDGLDGATPGGLDRSAMDTLLSGLGTRRFLLHNVHENGPEVFDTRWVLSYLAGPLTRAQISTLMDGHRTSVPAPEAVAAAPAVPARPAAAVVPAGVRPALSGDVPEVFVVVPDATTPAHYAPRLLAEVEVRYERVSLEVSHATRMVVLVDVDGNAPDFDGAEVYESVDVVDEPTPDAGFAPLPPVLATAKRYRTWEREVKRWVQRSHPLRLWRHAALQLVSRPDEDERAFRGRLAVRAHEARDARVKAVREQYAVKLDRLEARLRTAEDAVAREEAQASQKKVDTVVNVGVSLLGALLGRRSSRSTVSKMGTAARSAGRMQKEAADVALAERKAVRLRSEIVELEAALETELAVVALEAPEVDTLEVVEVKAKQTAMHLHTLALAWVPEA